MLRMIIPMSLRNIIPHVTIRFGEADRAQIPVADPEADGVRPGVVAFERLVEAIEPLGGLAVDGAAAAAEVFRPVESTPLRKKAAAHATDLTRLSLRIRQDRRNPVTARRLDNAATRAA